MGTQSRVTRRGGRLAGLLTLLLLAPLAAELLQVYLADLGGLGSLLFVWLFFVPLYGGAAVLIRETAVRTGRGWSGRLLLAAAFGVAMTTLIDGSLFTTARTDIDDWDTYVGAASVGGIGWSAAVAWVGGHVLMSVGAPIAVAEGVARDPRPWLGRVGLAVVAVLFVAVAGFIHGDQWQSNTVVTTPTRYAGAALVIGALIALAASPIGRPAPKRARRSPSGRACVPIGFVALAAFDFVPLSWAGLVLAVALLATMAVLAARWARSPDWSTGRIAALAYGALVARTITGFLSPLPQDTTPAQKLAQNLTYALLIGALGVLLWWRQRDTPRHQGEDTLAA